MAVLSLSLLLLLAGVGQSQGLEAGEDVLSARLRAAVRAEARDVRVQLRYELVVSDAADEVQIPIRILEVGGTRVDNLTVNGVAHALDRTAAPRVEASVDVSSGALVLELTYDVAGAVSDGAVRVPVASVGVSQREARPGTFQAEVDLPPEMRGLDRFPPGNELPVVPAFIAFGAMGAASAGAPVGFVFWGLFAAFGAIVIGYLLWMRRAERLDP